MVLYGSIRYGSMVYVWFCMVLLRSKTLYSLLLVCALSCTPALNSFPLTADSLLVLCTCVQKDSVQQEICNKAWQQ